jgi:hypothetical protein
MSYQSPYANIVPPPPTTAPIGPPGPPTPIPPAVDAALPPGIAGGPNPASAVRARTRENAKRDQRRRDDAKIARQVKGSPQPPPATPPNSTSDQPPQLAQPAAPVPQMTAPTMQQPSYQSPFSDPHTRGLEYAAIGLSLLFPGSPISHLAAGAAHGLKQGADEKYARDEQAAQQKYQVAREQAQSTFQNQEEAYKAAQLQAQTNFQNAQVKYEQDQQLRNQGIDPRTGKPFNVPPVLQRIVPPGQNRQPTLQDYENHERGLANFYTSVGAKALASEHDEAAKAYNAQAVEAQREAAAWAKEMATLRAEFMRQDRSIAAADARAARSEAATAGREQANQAEHEDFEMRMHMLDFNVTKRPEYLDKAANDSKAWSQSWLKAITPGTPKPVMGSLYAKPDGTTTPDKRQAAPVPPALTPEQQKVAQGYFSMIDKANDPVGMAQWLSEHTSIADNSSRGGTTLQTLMEERGRAAQWRRLANYLPITQNTYPTLPKGGTASGGSKQPDTAAYRQAVAAGTAKAKAAGLDPNDPQVKKAIEDDARSQSSTQATPTPLGTAPATP